MELGRRRLQQLHARRLHRRERELQEGQDDLEQPAPAGLRIPVFRRQAHPPEDQGPHLLRIQVGLRDDGAPPRLLRELRLQDAVRRQLQVRNAQERGRPRPVHPGLAGRPHPDVRLPVPGLHELRSRSPVDPEALAERELLPAHRGPRDRAESRPQEHLRHGTAGRRAGQERRHEFQAPAFRSRCPAEGGLQVGHQRRVQLHHAAGPLLRLPPQFPSPSPRTSSTTRT